MVLRDAVKGCVFTVLALGLGWFAISAVYAVAGLH